MESVELDLKFADSIEHIGRDGWNRLTGIENPFMRYEFLQGLEQTGCTTAATGWQPYHAAVYQRANPGQPVAVMPLYLKTNSWGEYVFDWSWANAWQRHGLDYYPKLVTAAPFTPSPGRRLFIATGHDSDAISRLLVEQIQQQAQQLGVSSWHVLFPEKTEHELLASLALQPRIATQFHWYNQGYDCFDSFLQRLNSRKRKAIRKERRQLADQGIRFACTEGADITAQQWTDFYRYYQTTYLVRGMQGYLQPGFFPLLAQTMAEQMLLVTASHQDQDIAAALFFKNEQTLFGRYWGCRQEIPFLHFETCYYQGIEYAIRHGQRAFDSGAQGEHKIQRGFEPITTYSNHWIANESFAHAIHAFLQQERPHVLAYQQDAARLLPFRQTDNDDAGRRE